MEFFIFYFTLSFEDNSQILILSSCYHTSAFIRSIRVVLTFSFDDVIKTVAPPGECNESTRSVTNLSRYTIIASLWKYKLVVQWLRHWTFTERTWPTVAHIESLLASGMASGQSCSHAPEKSHFAHGPSEPL